MTLPTDGLKDKDDEVSHEVLFDPTLAAYTPTETAAYGLRAIQAVQNGKDRAMGIGIDTIGDYFAPLRPGQVAGLVGQTSHYKSSFLHLLEHNAALQLKNQGRENAGIVHVSLEEDVEEQAFLEFARRSEEDAGKLARGDVKDWDKLVKVSYDISGIPIFRIGDSLERAEFMQPLYLANVKKALNFIRAEFRIELALIVIDYLQSIPLDPHASAFEGEFQRRLQVRNDAYTIRKMSVFYNSPIWVACQAKQVLGVLADPKKGPALLIPGMYDINESADVAQKFDRLFGIWLPSRSYPVGTKIKVGTETIEVTENLCFLKVIKQRGGLPAGRVWICDIDFRTNDIAVRNTTNAYGGD